ncbi:MAG TPA: adenylyl-sulfate kinase [Flavobacteriales bacterium]|jgi:adenylylsulfate kinase|nr:adenylyl-sulfate kinase [Salibacteraceae bacterium]HAS35846.1 adenylyl-sulfate kinase [Flavobacteriales bacterium]
MAHIPENIFPIHDRSLSREDRERLLEQKGLCLWFTGLSGSGKSTIALELEKSLYNSGWKSMLLDGDNVRTGLNNNLGFSQEDRKENIRRIAEVNHLMIEAGLIVLNSFVSPTEEIRSLAREIVGEKNFKEVFVNTPLEICEARDVKGLYKKARAGEIKNFTGIDSPFETPEKPFLDLKTEHKTPQECVEEILNALKL